MVTKSRSGERMLQPSKLEKSEADSIRSEALAEFMLVINSSLAAGQEALALKLAQKGVGLQLAEQILEKANPRKALKEEHLSRGHDANY